jgi:hypothetical protein
MYNTPVIVRIDTVIFPATVVGTTSPNPTVVIVTIARYIACGIESMSGFESCSKKYTNMPPEMTIRNRRNNGIGNESADRESDFDNKRKPKKFRDNVINRIGGRSRYINCIKDSSPSLNKKWR